MDTMDIAGKAVTSRYTSRVLLALLMLAVIGLAADPALAGEGCPARGGCYEK